MGQVPGQRSLAPINHRQALLVRVYVLASSYVLGWVSFSQPRTLPTPRELGQVFGSNKRLTWQRGCCTILKEGFCDRIADID